MSVWTTKSLDREHEYIVIKHMIPNCNLNVMGVKFRGGYAVVEKNSKNYHMLKKMPLLKTAKEFPLVFLKELPFITRTSDIKIVYGQDVYKKYLKDLTSKETIEAKEQKEIQEKNHLENSDRCKFRNKLTTSSNVGNLCLNQRLEESPNGYCFIHLLQDEKIKELGIIIPLAIPKKEKTDFKYKVIKQLAKMKKEGKF